MNKLAVVAVNKSHKVTIIDEVWLVAIKMYIELYL